MVIRPKLEDYKFPITENELDQFIEYAYDLEEYCNELEKALNKACAYIHCEGINGCPYRYDYKTITDEKMEQCYMCDYDYIDLDSELHNEEYLKKSIKCWREYFLKGETENDKK